MTTPKSRIVIAVPVKRTPEEDAAERREQQHLREQLEARHEVSRSYPERFREMMFDHAWQEGSSNGPDIVEEVYADLVNMLTGFAIK